MSKKHKAKTAPTGMLLKNVASVTVDHAGGKFAVTVHGAGTTDTVFTTANKALANHRAAILAKFCAL